jgi:hypothetical protein
MLVTSLPGTRCAMHVATCTVRTKWVHPLGALALHALVGGPGTLLLAFSVLSSLKTFSYFPVCRLHLWWQGAWLVQRAIHTRELHSDFPGGCLEMV